jgi:hypothetical protein
LERDGCEDSGTRLKTHGKNSTMASAGHTQRILRAALGHGVYPYTRVNPLVPIMNPMVNPEPTQ